MTTTFTRFGELPNYLWNGKINVGSDSFKAVLSNVAPSKANSLVLADITQLGAGNGYGGPIALTGVTFLETGAGTNIWQFTCADFVVTASGGSIGPFQYVVFYDDTPTSPLKPLIGFLDYSAAITITDGNTLTVDVQAAGLFQESTTP
jgi:hypothetical protein